MCRPASYRAGRGRPACAFRRIIARSKRFFFHSDRVAVPASVAHFFPEVDFFAVYGQREGVPVKPDPTAALQMIAELGMSPDRVYFVGDSRVDMETAVNAGMIPVGVTWGFRPREELLEFGAKYLIDKAEDALALQGEPA